MFDPQYALEQSTFVSSFSLRMLMGKKPLGPRTTTTARPTPSTEPPMTEARMKVLEKLRKKPTLVADMENPFATTKPDG